MISDLRRKYIQKIAERDLYTKQLEDTENLLVQREIFLENCQKARVIIQTVAQTTQERLEHHISSLVTMALASVFPDPYTFVLQFVKRREKTEADLIFVKDGNEGSPMDVSGGGPLDVASFALRTATWAIKPTRNVLILDEPFRFVSRNLQLACSEMLKYISEKLEIQLIVVSHIPEIMDKADKVFNVTNENGISVVR